MIMLAPGAVRVGCMVNYCHACGHLLVDHIMRGPIAESRNQNHRGCRKCPCDTRIEPWKSLYLAPLGH